MKIGGIRTVECDFAKRIEVIVEKLIPGILGKTFFTREQKREMLKARKEKALDLLKRAAENGEECEYTSEKINAAFEAAFLCVGGEPTILESYL